MLLSSLVGGWGGKSKDDVVIILYSSQVDVHLQGEVTLHLPFDFPQGVFFNGIAILPSIPVGYLSHSCIDSEGFLTDHASFPFRWVDQEGDDVIVSLSNLLRIHQCISFWSSLCCSCHCWY